MLYEIESGVESFESWSARRMAEWVNGMVLKMPPRQKQFAFMKMIGEMTVKPGPNYKPRKKWSDYWHEADIS